MPPEKTPTPSTLPLPNAGGSYLRNDQTGELIRAMDLQPTAPQDTAAPADQTDKE